MGNVGFLRRRRRKGIVAPAFRRAQRTKPSSASRARRYLRLKRALDIAIPLLALPVVLPLMGLCALAIVCTDPGPVFYVQERTGRGGRRFRMVKLRTMVRDADLAKKDLAQLNVQTGPDFKVPDDPRVTRVGRFLRRTSLDEVPQLWNVLKGDMSLVGPRPTSFEAMTYDLWHTERLETKPGLTGLWQISGRSNLGFDERVRLDIAYVRQRSLALDLRILALTPAAVFLGNGAY